MLVSRDPCNDIHPCTDVAEPWVGAFGWIEVVIEKDGIDVFAFEPPNRARGRPLPYDTTVER